MHIPLPILEKHKNIITCMEKRMNQIRKREKIDMPPFLSFCLSLIK
jgi:hypothetical protein